MIPIIIWGAGGRMGERLIALVRDDSRLTLHSAIDSLEHPDMGKDTGLLYGQPENGVPLSTACNAIESPGVVIDFSLPGGTCSACAWAVKNGWALVSGTTGLSPEEKGEIGKASAYIPVIWESNFSIGIQLLFKLTEIASKALPLAFDCSIVEAHHTSKLDRPSGTARTLENKILEETDTQRRLETVGLRMSNIVGEHSVRFRSHQENITLNHTALDRNVFARGALEAAYWISGKTPGIYSMLHVLGLEIM